MLRWLTKWFTLLKGTDYLHVQEFSVPLNLSHYVLLKRLVPHIQRRSIVFQKTTILSYTTMKTSSLVSKCRLKGNCWFISLAQESVCASLMHKWTVLQSHHISVALNIGGRSEGHVYLAVRVPVNVVVVPERFQFQQGDSVSLSCYASGTPTPTFVWKKDGVVLKQVSWISGKTNRINHFAVKIWMWMECEMF
jgi:hypothetical protein